MQHDLLVCIAKVHAVKNNVSLQLCVGRLTSLAVIVLPCPQSGTLLRLFDLAPAVLFGIHQLNIALIQLRCLIHQLEETICTCQSHHDTVELLADLVDGHAEGLV